MAAKTNVVETKSLTGNRAQPFNEWLNKKAQTDRWLQASWLGSEHAEDLFARHPEGTELKAQALDYFYGSVVSNLMQKAMPQLRATKQVLSLPNAMCGVALLNDTDNSFEALELEMTLAKHLSKRGEDGSRLCGPNDFVLLVSQTPKDTASKRLYLGLIIAPDCASPDMVYWYVMQSLRYRWASEHGLALAPVHANRG